MFTVDYVGEWGVKNCQNYAYVIYGCPLMDKRTWTDLLDVPGFIRA